MAIEEILKEKPNYYAILPAEVRYDELIIPNAKILYAEITALTDKKGYCWASNNYFAQLYDVSKITVSKWISHLEKAGYIESKLIYKEGTKEIVNRYIKIIKNPISEKVNTYMRKGIDPINEKINTPISDFAKDNNTSINTTSNNITPIVPLVEEAEVLTDVEIKFNKFWEKYPKKKAKPDAFKNFKKIDLKLFDYIIEKLDLFKQTKEWQKEKGKYIPYPATWLNQKRWEDEISDDEIEITIDQKVEKAREWMKYR